MNRIFIILPAYNEAQVIGPVIREIQQHGFPRIIVVDDGSIDDTGILASQAGAFVVTHPLNRGKGAAVKTGLEAAKLSNASLVVTMDADGQHSANNIAALVRPILERHCDVTLGTRLWNISAAPRHRILFNKIGNTATWLIHQKWVNDSQSGFRAYSRRAIELINTRADFYDYDSEVIQEIRRHKIRFTEVPIDVRYTTYSSAKPTRQNLANGIRTAARMVWQRFA